MLVVLLVKMTSGEFDPWSDMRRPAGGRVRDYSELIVEMQINVANEASTSYGRWG